MVSKMIDVGAKVDIRMVSQLERSTQIDENVKIYKSQVCDILENGELELLMPIEAGKLMLLSLGIRYEFVFYNKSGLYRADYIDGTGNQKEIQRCPAVANSTQDCGDNVISKLKD